jgi:ligand-binding sensor domain-containing protein
MKRDTASTDELAEATERVTEDNEYVIDGVPAEVTNVTNVEGEIWIDTNAGMFTRSEWHSKMCNGEISEV